MKEKTEGKIEKNRNQMMQNLFGDQSEDDENEENDENEEEDYVLESNRHSNYLSDEGDVVKETEGDAYMDRQGEGELDSEGEMNDFEQQQPAYSENDQEQSSQIEGGEHHEESEARETDSESREEYAQDVVTSRRREVADSGSEDHNFVDQEDDEVEQGRSPGSAEDERDGSSVPPPVAEIRDVFGDSDEDEPEYAAQNDIEQDRHFPDEEEEGYEKNFRPDDLVHDDYARYESEEDTIDVKSKDKPVGPTLELAIPLRQPPTDPEKMNVIRVSNIMGIDPKPFDPKTYVEEDVFVTDESGTKKRIRLENNIVRWRSVTKPDGTKFVESNARFVRWSDGSLQLLIGNEVLDTSIQDAQHDHAHLFLRHGKGILQSQGRLLKKMRFMPSSLSSNSHRLLTALVDSRHKKVYKVKNCVTDIDPEREKELKLKVESQTIRANMLLKQKRERVNRKYSRPVDRGHHLSSTYLEECADEEDEYEPRRGQPHLEEEDMEAEAQAVRRIMNAKKVSGLKDIPRKLSMTAMKPSRRQAERYERDESEYETDGEEVEEESPRNNEYEDSEPEYVDSEPEEEEEAREVEASDEEEEELQPSVRQSAPSRKRKEIESDEDSPPRKAPAHRRMAVISDSDDD